MKNLKYLFIFVFLFGCVQPKFESVKIVDEYGKTAKINKIIPAFNEEQMLKQKEAFNNNNTTTKVNKFFEKLYFNFSSIDRFLYSFKYFASFFAIINFLKKLNLILK